jgi:ATP-dependent Lon protease
VVRKDLTKLVKEGANVPVYVLEYLLGQHCASNDEAIIEDGLKTVKRILAENYVRPDEAEKIKSIIRERGSLKIIDKVTVTLNEKRDVYEALLSNLGTKGVEISTATCGDTRSCWPAASGPSSRWSISSRKARRARRSSSGT